MIGEDYKTGTSYAFRVPLRDSTGALQTGLTPAVTIYKPDNTAESSPPSLTELGSTGVYRFAYTPASAGAYTFIVAADGCLTTVFTVQVRATERGDTYSRIGAPAGASIAADIAALPTDSDVQTAAAAALTAYDPPTAAELTSGLAGLNDLSSAEVQTAAAAALTAYDPPTNAELTAAVSPLALEATLTAIKGDGWSTETLAAIDALIDAIKAKTDLIPASPAAVGSAMTLADGAITSTKFATGAITATAIGPNAIGASELASDAVTEIQSGLALAADLSTVGSNVLAVKAKTDNLPASPAAVGSQMDLISAPNATAVAVIQSGLATSAEISAMNDLSSAEAQAAAAAALTAYDPPTAAELTAAVSPLALEATLTAIKGAGWSTETLAAIDALIDAIKAKTDNLPASPAAVGSAMTLTSGERSSIADAVLDEEVNSAGATDNSLRAAAKAAWAQGFGKWVLSGTTLTLYGTDGVTAVRTFTLDSATDPTSRTPA